MSVSKHSSLGKFLTALIVFGVAAAHIFAFCLVAGLIPTSAEASDFAVLSAGFGIAGLSGLAGIWLYEKLIH